MEHKIKVFNIESEQDWAIITNQNKTWGYFLFCIYGDATIIIDHKAISLTAHSVANIIGGSSVTIPKITTNIKLLVIGYNDAVKNIIGSHSLIVFCPVTGLLQSTLKVEEFSNLLLYAKQIKKYMTNPLHFDLALLHLILIIKELDHLHKLSNSTRRIKNEVILRFINLLNQNYKIDKSVEFYCTQLHITNKTLYRAFKENIGISPKEFINFKLNMEAKKLLIHSDWSIKEVSVQLGFQSPYYFTNFFKKFNNTTPTLFKETLSNFSIRMS